MKANPADIELKSHQAQEALLLILSGDSAGGLALYDECVRGDFVYRLPLGLHLRFLEKADRTDEAAALRDLAIERGGNIAVRGNAVEAEDHATAAEYEDLFAAGTGNSRMVFDYLLCLSRIGRHGDVAAVLDSENLLKVTRLDLTIAGESNAAAAINRTLLEREAQTPLLDTDQSIRQMRKLESLDQWQSPAVDALLTALTDEAERLRAQWARSDHQLARCIPKRLRMKSWALISRGEGFNVEHIHGRGWVTGVYYPVGLPEDVSGGELRIGPPSDLPGGGAGWPELIVRPEPGVLVIMPSYYNHWTQPLGQPGLRTSIAFDYRPPAVEIGSVKG